jgi:hypothetical protein
VSPSSTSSDSIICGGCGRCRCAACRSPRPLPSTWLCDNSCLLSPESVVGKADISYSRLKFITKSIKNIIRFWSFMV